MPVYLLDSPQALPIRIMLCTDATINCLMKALQYDTQSYLLIPLPQYALHYPSELLFLFLLIILLGVLGWKASRALYYRFLRKAHAFSVLPVVKITRNSSPALSMRISKAKPDYRKQAIIAGVILCTGYMLFAQHEGTHAQSNAGSVVGVDVVQGMLLFGCSGDGLLGTIQDTGDTGPYQIAHAIHCTITNLQHAAGYTLVWQATGNGTASGSMINQTGKLIAPYQPQTAGVPELWSVMAAQTAWGGRLSSTSTTVDTARWGIDGISEKWLNVATGSTVLATTSGLTASGGDLESIGMRAQVGADVSQEAGTYTVPVIFTIVPN